MKISNNLQIHALFQSRSKGYTPQLAKSANSLQQVQPNQDNVTISSSGYEKNQESVFEKFFENLSDSNKTTIQDIETKMEPLLEKEEAGTISKKEQEGLDTLFQEFDEIIVNNSDENTQKILLA